MTVDQAIELGRAATLLGLLIAAPVLFAAVCTGLVTSLLQAVTQLQDQTLSVVPKVVAVLVTGLLVLPWALDRLVAYSTDVIRGIVSGP